MSGSKWTGTKASSSTRSRGSGIVQIDFVDAVDAVDSDGDGVANDGDVSGNATDKPCTGGESLLCDDNCLGTPNLDQADGDDDGIGDACEAPVAVVPSLAPWAWMLLAMVLMASGWLGTRGSQQA